jgi:hypothetical protein
MEIETKKEKRKKEVNSPFKRMPPNLKFLFKILSKVSKKIHPKM